MEHLFADNPEIGIIGAFAAFITPFLEFISPLCQILSIFGGLAIMYYTIRIQRRKWLNMRDKKDE
jgi:hypothetical protein